MFHLKVFVLFASGTPIYHSYVNLLVLPFISKSYVAFTLFMFYLCLLLIYNFSIEFICLMYHLHNSCLITILMLHRMKLHLI